MRLVRDGDELDIQLEGRIVRIDPGARILRFASVVEAIACHADEIARALADGFVDAPDPAVDDDARLVHADELQLRGDPVGELVMIARELDGDIASSDPKQRRRAENRLAALIDEHHDRWFGPLARHVRKPTRKAPAIPAVAVEWRLGFAEQVTIRGTPQIAIDAAYAKLREIPLSRQIRRLVIGAPHGEPPATLEMLGPSYATVLDAMLVHGIPSRLRELVIGDDEAHRRPTLRFGHELAAVVFAARSLEVLRVVGGHGSLALESESLRVLEICDVVPEDLHSLGDARLPALEELTLRARDPIAVPALLEQFPSVVHLMLERFIRQRGDRPLLDALGAIGRLQTLALPWCSLDDRDLVTIIRDAPRYASLVRFDLRNNSFSAHLAATAKRAVPAIRVRQGRLRY